MWLLSPDPPLGIILKLGVFFILLALDGWMDYYDARPPKRIVKTGFSSKLRMQRLQSVSRQRHAQDDD